MKLTKNFMLQEFVPKTTYEKYGENAIWHIDNSLAIATQLLRDVLQKEFVENHLYYDIRLQVNTWSYGGDREFSGYRPPECNIGAKESQHRPGRAIDFNILLKRADGKWEVVPSLKVQEVLKKPTVWKKLNAHWTTIEKDTVGWTHLDMRFRDASEYLNGPAVVSG